MSLLLSTLRTLADEGRYSNAVDLVTEMSDDDMTLIIELVKYMNYVISLDRPNIWEEHASIFKLSSFVESCFVKKCYKPLIGIPKEDLTKQIKSLFRRTNKPLLLSAERVRVISSLDISVSEFVNLTMSLGDTDAFVAIMEAMDRNNEPYEGYILPNFYEVLFSKKGLVSEQMIVDITTRRARTYIGLSGLIQLDDIGKIALRRGAQRFITGHATHMSLTEGHTYAPFLEMREHLINLILCFRRRSTSFFIVRAMLDAVWDSYMHPLPLVYDA